jgi:hypothetical protein
VPNDRFRPVAVTEPRDYRAAAYASTGHPRTTTAGIESSQDWRPFALISIAIGLAQAHYVIDAMLDGAK